MRDLILQSIQECVGPVNENKFIQEAYSTKVFQCESLHQLVLESV